MDSLRRLGDPHRAEQRDHAQPPDRRLARGSPNLEAAHQERPGVGPGRIHVPDQHAEGKVQAGIPQRCG